MRTPSHGSAVMVRTVRYGPRCGAAYQNPTETFSSSGSSSAVTPSVACSRILPASSAVSATTVTSPPPVDQRTLRAVQPGPAVRQDSRLSSTTERRILPSAGTRVASSRRESRREWRAWGWAPVVKGVSRRASTTS